MTDPNLDPQETESPTHIEVEPPALENEPPPPSAPPAGGPPRAFPQHYNLLFGAFCVLIGSMAVWERAHVFGAEIEGEATHAGSILMVLAGYSVLVGVLNIMQGRLAGMLAAFMTGVLALYFGIPGIVRTFDQPRCLGFDEIGAYVAEEKIPERFVNEGIEFPAKALSSISTWQGKFRYFIGQFGPGPFLATAGGALLIWVFLGAMFGGKKKKEPEPQPTARRRGRR